MLDAVTEFLGTETCAEVGALSKPRITDLGGLCSKRPMAASIAIALALLGRVVATSLAQHWAQWKL